MADRRVNVWISLKAKGAVAGLKRLGGGFVSLGRRGVSAIAGIARSVLSLKGLIMGALVYGALYKAKQAFDVFSSAAADAEETRGKFSAVFKHLTRDAEAWAERYADAVGRSRTAVKGWMATLQDTFVPLGYSREEAYKLSQQLVKLGVDLASFNNLRSEEAIERLVSALVGNHETVRKFGVIIDEAGLKQEALRSGIVTSAKDLTAAQKVQARYQLIMKGTTDAQGDAIRTADSFANRQRRAAANWTNLKERIGTFLTQSPAVRNFFADMSKGLERADLWLKTNRASIQKFVDGGLALLKGAFRGVRDTIQDLAADGTLFQWFNYIKLGLKSVWLASEYVGRSLMRGARNLPMLNLLRMKRDKAWGFQTQAQDAWLRSQDPGLSQSQRAAARAEWQSFKRKEAAVGFTAEDQRKLNMYEESEAGFQNRARTMWNSAMGTAGLAGDKAAGKAAWEVWQNNLRVRMQREARQESARDAANQLTEGFAGMVIAPHVMVNGMDRGQVEEIVNKHTNAMAQELEASMRKQQEGSRTARAALDEAA